MYEYEIEERKFVQKPLVWGQVKQMKTFVSEIKVDSNFNPIDALDLLGDNIPKFCAIVLREVGQNPKDKDVEELARFFEEALDVGTSMQVVEDFFVCNPTDLISRNLLGLARTIKQAMGLKLSLEAKPSPEMKSTELSAPSPEETSPNEI